MSAVDELKNLRAKGYSGKTSTIDGDKEGMDSGERNSTPRIISLTDDEQKAFAQAKPGEDLACEVHGSLEDDGHFHVMSVVPLQGSYGQEQGTDENQMAGQVAQRVMPGIVPSPS